ncbi:MAG TPA: RNA-binding transcriptional accessory protein [Candidatus Faecimorpha stercoravium]|nr:RNA-binding transcriptional accessory protein [Candidatus Faecimorpha stercoravium]
MNTDYAQSLATQFDLEKWQVTAVIDLLDEGNTIPFIARYRKEAHGSLDDQKIRELSDRLAYLRSLDEKRDSVYSLIEGAGAMTDEIASALSKAQTLSEIDDIYRPFRPKRKTRASVAKEKGLAPLAEEILAQHRKSPDPLTLASAYIDEEKGVPTAEEALQGAMDIIAEQVSDDANLRKRLREEMMEDGQLVSKGTTEEPSVYSMYYDFHQSVKNIASHRILAVNRGEREGFLRVSIETDEVKAQRIVTKAYVRNNTSLCCETVKNAALDGYTRLIFPALEREIRGALTEQASESAIRVFGMNLRQLLLQPPVKGKVTIGLDPGYRTGCKTAVVDATGRVLETTVIYPTHSEAKIRESKHTLRRLIDKYHAELIAIGNGTASKETEIFTAEFLQEEGLDEKVRYMVVSEAGASVYSASKLAAEEYPDLDLTLRSAVSIAHRLQDPLAELVKIDPKSVGVGQYQHDMPQKRLSETLDGVVEDCVNTVGVDLNTASPSLLKNVAGITPTIAKNIVAYREENGAFHSRAELKKVSKLGPKAFEQCAGFLRVLESDNILDHTAVHPESYKAASALLKQCGYQKTASAIAGYVDLPEKIQEQGGEEVVAQELGIGLPTLRDIVTELRKPGRDPREEIPVADLRSDIKDIKDLKVGMELQGTVRNVVDFGAFVDIGVHQDGLVHITQIRKEYVKHPADVLKVGDIVTVWVLSVDLERNRIGLTMKKPRETT